MRYLCLLLLLMGPVAANAEGRLTPRPLDAIASETFAHARARSAIVRALVETLEASNVVVHIETARQMPAGLGGATRFVTTRGGYRYVRITLGADLTLAVRSAILGHELQHACEVAQSSAADIASIRELFQREGQRDGNYFETKAAIRTQHLVWTELRSRSLQAEPVTKFNH